MFLSVRFQILEGSGGHFGGHFSTHVREKLVLMVKVGTLDFERQYSVLATFSRFGAAQKGIESIKEVFEKSMEKRMRK